MSEEKTVDETTKKNDTVEETTKINDEEKETSKNETTTEETTKETTKETTEEVEENPYEKQLKEMTTKNEQTETENRQKTGALKEEREKTEGLEKDKKELEKDKTDLEAKLKIKDEDDDGKYLTSDKANEIFDNKLAKQRIEDDIEKISDDDSEKKLIRKLMEKDDNGIARANTVKDAKTLANAYKLDEYESMEEEREQQETIMAGFSSGKSKSKGKTEDFDDPVLKEAAKDLPENVRKNLI